MTQQPCRIAGISMFHGQTVVLSTALAPVTALVGLTGHQRTALLATLAQVGHAEPRASLGGIAVNVQVDGPARPVAMIDVESLADELKNRRTVPERSRGGAASQRLFEHRMDLARKRMVLSSTRQRELADDVRIERQHVDNFAALALDEARRALAALEDSVGISQGDASGIDVNALEARRSEFARRVSEIDFELTRLVGTSAASVLQASLALRAAAGESSLPSDEAVRLADDLVAVQGVIEEIESRVCGELLVSPDELLRRVDDAQRMVATISSQLGGARIAPEDRAELEVAHDAVEQASAKVSGRFPPRGARKALEDAQERERHILDRLGFPTWSAFVMETTNYGSSQDARRRLVEAIAEQDDALAAWNSYTQRLGREPGFAEALERLDRISIAAERLVGSVDDLELALRSYRVELVHQHVGEIETTAASLRHALIEAGAVHVDDESDPGRLLGIADTWMASLAHQSDVRGDLEVERGRLHGELTSIDRLLQQTASLGSAAVVDMRLREARDEVETASSRLDRHRSAIARLADLLAELNRIDVEVASAADEIESLSELLAVTATDVDAETPQALTAAAITAAAEQVAGVAAGSLRLLPVVLIASRDDDATLVSAAVSALVPAGQLIVLGDSDELIMGVRAASGLVVELPAMVGV